MVLGKEAGRRYGVSFRVLSPGASASCPRRSGASVRFCGASTTDFCRIEANRYAVSEGATGRSPLHKQREREVWGAQLLIFFFHLASCRWMGFGWVV